MRKVHGHWVDDEMMEVDHAEDFEAMVERSPQLRRLLE